MIDTDLSETMAAGEQREDISKVLRGEKNLPTPNFVSSENLLQYLK